MKLFESIVRQGPLTTLPEPETVRIPLSCHRPDIKCGQKMARGIHIGGGYYAPISGTVTEVHPTYICIKAEAVDEPSPRDMGALSGNELRTALNDMGAGLPEGPAQTLIINGVEPEPGVTAFAHMLDELSRIVQLGLSTAQSVFSPNRTVLAVEAGASQSLEGCEKAAIENGYPNGIDPLVAKAITGMENPDNVAVLSVGRLFELGMIMDTGLPCDKTVVTCGETDFVTTVGTPVDLILTTAHQTVRHGDTVVLGGLMRGEAAHSLQQGISKDTYGLFVVPKGQYPPVEDSPCIGCGECIPVCPARIDPATISGYAEFRMYDKCREHDIDACMECGMCGFFCIARRPLLQYIRLAKQHLAQADTCKLNDQGEG
jgi:electron transport complex protein RnfC